MKIRNFVMLLAMPLLACAFQFPDASSLMSPECWRMNSSGSMEIDYDTTEQAMRFSVTFAPNVDKWVYPQFRLPKGMTLNGAQAISFDLKVIPGDEPIAYKTANVLCGKFCSFQPPPAGEWQRLRVTLPPENATQQLSQFAIGANPSTLKFTYLLKNITFEGTPVKQYLPPGIVCDAPATIFTHGQDVVLRCTRRLAGLKYRLRDWQGRELLAGTWPEDGDKELVLKGFKPGYYLVSTENDTATKLRDFSFTVVVPETARMQALGVKDLDAYARARRHSAFAIDSAQSWVARPGNFDCPYFDGDSYVLTTEVARLAGIPHVRERLSWREVQPKPETLPRLSYYLRNADMLHQGGMLVSGMYHDAPGWADKTERLPRDLKAVYDFAKNASEQFGERMGNWEFWNEQDIGFAPEPVWDYAATMKAAYLGFRAAHPERLVANGAICTGASNPYVHAMYDNDIAKYTDLYNFHTYSGIVHYDNIFKDIRDLFAKYNMEQRAIWCTEFGTNLEGHATQDGVRKGLKAHSPEQEMILAEFYPKAQLRQMFLGASRNYYFILPPFNERNGCKDWGLMRRDGSAKPSIAAFSTATYQLVAATMLGELNVGSKCRAYLLQQPDGSQVVVFWALSEVDTKADSARLTGDHATDITLKLPTGSYTLTDMMGAESQLAVQGDSATLTATRYPVYISGLRGLRPDLPAHPAGDFQRYVPAADEDMTVIIRADVNQSDFRIGNRKSSAQMDGVSGRMRLQIWNLSTESKRGHLEVTGAKLDGLPESLELPPMGKAEVDVVLHPDCSDGIYVGKRVVITALMNGKRSSRFSMRCDLLGLYLRDCAKVALDWTKPEIWRKNSSADEHDISYDADEQALRFDFLWKRENDRWAYPEHLLDLPAESLVGAKFLEFEVKSVQDKVENDFTTQLLMLVEGTAQEVGRAHYLGYAAPLAQWETRRIPLHDKQELLSRIRQIRLGGNPKGHKLTLWFRNFRLLKDNK